MGRPAEREENSNFRAAGRTAQSGDLPDGQFVDPGVQPPLQKFSGSAFDKNQFNESGHPPHRGAYHDRHERGAGCGGRGSVLRAKRLQGGFYESVSDTEHADERRLLRTAKSCGPDAPTLASSLRRHVGPTGLRQPTSADDGGKQARSPGRARSKPLKPLRAGMPGDPGATVVTTLVYYQHTAHEAAGATGTRHSPRPQGAKDKRTARAHRAAGREAVSAV